MLPVMLELNTRDSDACGRMITQGGGGEAGSKFWPRSNQGRLTLFVLSITLWWRLGIQAVRASGNSN